MTFTDVHTNRQKLGTILENKVVQNLSLEKNVFTKKRSPTLIFSKEFCFAKIHQLILEKNPWSMLIHGQKSCFLGLTIFEIPQPNGY